MLHLHNDEQEYPTSDGQPMAETDLHRQIMVNLIEALTRYYRGRQVYVSGNILLYYQRGNPRAHLAPDVLVCLDLPPGPREVYKVWEEGKAPDLVIEVTSKTTRKKDLHTKKDLYESLKVQEYLLFDPRRDYLEPRFQVFRYQGSGFVPVLVPEATGYTSPLLQLTFRVVDDELRISESPDGPLLPTPAEQAQQAEEQTQRAEEQSQRAERYAARLKELGIDPNSL